MTARYVVLLPGNESAWEEATQEHRDAVYARHDEFGRRLRENGHTVVGGAEPDPLARDQFVRADADGRVMVSDGPFAETTEQAHRLLRGRDRRRRRPAAGSSGSSPDPTTTGPGWAASRFVASPPRRTARHEALPHAPRPRARRLGGRERRGAAGLRRRARGLPPLRGRAWAAHLRRPARRLRHGDHGPPPRRSTRPHRRSVHRVGRDGGRLLRRGACPTSTSPSRPRPSSRRRMPSRSVPWSSLDDAGQQVE